MRVLLVGWFSFRHGEATAGDVQSLRAVQEALVSAEIAHDVAWSPVFHPDGVGLDEIEPTDYTHLVFVCGPLHGEQIEKLHSRFSHCRRIAVGVSVVAPEEPVTQDFHAVLARDGEGMPARWDLAAVTPANEVPSMPIPVVGVVLAERQSEYGDRDRNTETAERVTEWLAERTCAPVPLSTRLDAHDWRHCTTPEQVTCLLRRLDLVVTTRLHGLVFALRAGTPAIAVDPVAGGGKVTAQARALGWPAVITMAGAHEETAALADGLARHWRWCLSPDGRRAAGNYLWGRARSACRPHIHGSVLLRGLLNELAE